MLFANSNQITIVIPKSLNYLHMFTSNNQTTIIKMLKVHSTTFRKSKLIDYIVKIYTVCNFVFN